MPYLPDLQGKLLGITEALVRFRFHLASVTLDLERSETDEADDVETAETELRSNLECALVDHFDPLLRTLVDAAGSSPKGRILEAALDLAGVKQRLKTMSENLPRSPREDAMLDGEIPTDKPTEMRITINAVIEDQLDLAMENLLHAAGYNAPEPV